MEFEKKCIKCLICLEDIEKDIDFLPCIHGFHRECINGWIKEKPICPICKVPVYINTPEQLNMYNCYMDQHERNAQEESRFYQQLSAGNFDNINPNMPIGNNTQYNDNSETLLNVMRNNDANMHNNPDVMIRRMPNIGNVLQIFETILNIRNNNQNIDPASNSPDNDIYINNVHSINNDIHDEDSVNE